MEDMTPSVVETHVSTLFFVGDRVYKLKKPVRTGFLDFTSIEARRLACEHEVDVNRPYAPDVYLDVLTVSSPDGTRCDHLVAMRRLPAALALSALVDNGQRVDDGLRDLAHLIATVHGRAPTSPTIALAATSGALTDWWWANVRECRQYLREPADRAALARIFLLAERYLAGREPLLEQRIADARVIEGHGDLRAADVFLLPDGPRVLDAIEFDDSLRHVDALADVAFLAMDLERLRRPDLAELFLDYYREFSGDIWPASLARHYIAHRALIRAKVELIRASQGDARSRVEATRLLHLSLGQLEHARVRLVLVGGLPGAGKSTLSTFLGDVLGATILRSDEVRKNLVGVALDDHSHGGAYHSGIYDDCTTDATYTELCRQAAVLLSHGESVILDASWSDANRRAAARDIARSTHSDLVEISCVVPREVAVARITARVAAGRDPSDATVEVAALIAEEADPWPSAAVVRCDGTPAASVAMALNAMG
jgi:aminoglycoside phosphotransferase family enzyme/predicted kinase